MYVVMASHSKKFRTYYRAKRKKKYTQDIIDLARSEARESNMRQKHGCVITDKSGNYISKGHNTSYSYLYHGKRSLHAECSAIRNAVRQYKRDFLKGSVLYVIRIGVVGDEDSLRSSMPCKGCANAIRRFRISRAYYSTNDAHVMTMIEQVKI